MRIKIFTLFLLAFLFSNCSEDMSPEVPTYSNIMVFRTTIDSPIQERDYSYHNEGYEGIFENPDSSQVFTGTIEIFYHDNDSIKYGWEDIEITWRSDIDGILFQGKPDENLKSEITSVLTKGVHTIYFEASIPSVDGISSSATRSSVRLSNAITLTSEPTGKSVKLNWTKYEGSGFQSYLIYRDKFTPIAEVQDINTLEYQDIPIDSWVEDYPYQVIVNTSENPVHPIGSNLSYNHAGHFLEFPHKVYKMVKDPLRSRIYATVGYLSGSATYGLLILDTDSETLTIVDHILQEEIFSDMDLSPDGQYLFLCQKNVEKITKIDLNTLSTSTIATGTNGAGMRSIEVYNNNVIYCHRNFSGTGSTPFYIYNGNNGGYITGPVSDFYHGDIELNNETGVIYGGESNSSAGEIQKFNINETVFLLNLDLNTAWSSSVSYPEEFLLLSEDNQHLFWGNFQLDLDLNIIRTFDKNMKACSPNNIYSSDIDKLYDFNDMSVIFEYPELSVFSDASFLFMDDNTLIMARENETQFIQEQRTHFFKIDIE